MVGRAAPSSLVAVGDGARRLRDRPARYLVRRVGVVAAVVATLQPYLVWHDLHGNREILDQLLGAALFCLALVAAAPLAAPRRPRSALVSGIAILSNTRLVLLPLVLAAYLLWRGGGLGGRASPCRCSPVVALAPWVVRNKVEVGCFAITTDARALWKANNLDTYDDARATGIWIDDVPDIPERAPARPTEWYTAEEAGGTTRTTAQDRLDECAPAGATTSTSSSSSGSTIPARRRS